MKKTPRKRRRQGKTDYANRVGLLKSEKPRLVFRKTNKYFLVQYVLSEEAKDKIVFGTTSKELLKHGWPKDFAGSLKSIPAAYLTGYLFGKKIQAAKAETPIMDLGMIRTLHKTKVFGFLKGAIDSGLDIACKEEAFPEEDRIQGKAMKKDFSAEFEKIKSNLEKL